MALSVAYWLGLVYILLTSTVTYTETTAQVATADLSRRMFTRMDEGVITFQGSSSHQNIDAITACLRMVTDPKQYDRIFQLTMLENHTISFYKSNVLGYSMGVDKRYIDLYPMLVVPSFGKVPPWTSLCVTWNSDTGMSQMWKDGMMSSRKGIARKQKFSGNPVKMTISEFEGQLTDIHVWDQVLPLSTLRAYMSGGDYPSGNLLSWRDMTYTTDGYVVLEDVNQIQDKPTENGQEEEGMRGDGK